MSQNRGLVRVTYEMLLDALGLPKSMRILAIVQKPEDILNGTFYLVAGHASLPEHLEGAAPRVMTVDALQEKR